MNQARKTETTNSTDLEPIMGETLPPKTDSEAELLDTEEALKEARHARNLAKQKRRADLQTLPERLAGVRFYVKNFKPDGADEAFPHEPWLRTIDQVFLEAEGGPLAVEVYNFDWERERAEKKQKVYGELMRFVIIKNGCTEAEAFMALDEATKKVKKKCGQPSKRR